MNTENKTENETNQDETTDESTTETANVKKVARPECSVTVERLLAKADEAGVVLTEQASFYKLSAPTPNRKAVYVSKTKRVATRIDIAGFSVDHSAIMQIARDEAKSDNRGKVHCQIQPRKVGDDLGVFAAFDLVLAALLSSEEGDMLAPRKVKSELTTNAESDDEQTAAQA